MKYLTPKEAARDLGMTVSSISRCVSAGAPVHRWGATGYRYRIDVEEFAAWMDSHGREVQARKNGTQAAPAANVVRIDAAQMARRRQDLIAAIGG